MQAFPDAARALGDVGLTGPLWCTLRYESALFAKTFERPGPKSVSPAMNCSGVDVVDWWKWMVDMRCSFLQWFSCYYDVVVVVVRFHQSVTSAA